MTHTQFHRSVFVSLCASCAGYCGYYIAHFLSVLCVIPLFIVLTPFPLLQKRVAEKLLHIFVIFLSQRFFPGLGLYRISCISGFDKLCSPVPTIFVANHRSRIDALLLLSLLPQSAFVVKSKYAQTPLFNHFGNLINAISIDQNSLTSISHAMQQCLELINKNKNILIFPEGTRAHGHKMLPFKELAFKIAVENNLPIVPIIVHSNRPFMAKRRGSAFPLYPVTFSAHCLLPIKPTPLDTPTTLSATVYKTLSQELKNLDKGTSWGY